MAPTTPRTLVVAVAASLALVAVSALGEAGPAAAAARPAPATAFVRASAQTGVPAPLLEAVCYLEGRLSMHGGHPSLDNGFGCMHLVKNDRADTLDQAARDLHVGVGALKTDLATNVRGAAMVLRDEARALSPAHRTPTGLAGWYGAVAAYSHAPVRSTALMYAAAAYRILRTGFTARTDAGESLTLAPQAVRPVTATADSLRSDTAAPPAGCHLDNKVDYPGAVDCIVAPKTFDCNVSPYPYPGCTYQSADRPQDFDIDAVVIHETEEGPAQNALNTFQDHNSGVSIHYLVGSDGTVYQLLHEADIAYQDGNFSSNEHTIGIEHAGYDATGWQWFNAAQ
ncbi:MAG: N-acetylmuramoyl-L-alanine amidase, partial [Mycobacteriales bacterium]